MHRTICSPHTDRSVCCTDRHLVKGSLRLATPKQRMMMIDAVVHELHLTLQGEPSNFAARNFIEGTRPKIVALLEELANGPGSTVAEGARARFEAARQQYRDS